jgi:hypothetical protein
MQRQTVPKRGINPSNANSRSGIRHQSLDNSILSRDDPQRVQPLCDGLSADKIDALLRKWLRKRHPFTARDRQARYLYQVSIVQAEFSLTQVLDRPSSEVPLSAYRGRLTAAARGKTHRLNLNSNTLQFLV